MSSFWSVGLQFRVVEGPNKGRTYPLDAQEMTIGRARSAGDRAPGWILLLDDTVSRIHADLRWVEKEEAYVLSNRSETNPTQVNKQIQNEIALKAGDQIQVGHTVLDLQQADFRFGGMKPPNRSARPAVASPLPQQPNLQYSQPTHDMEKQINTKKAGRVVALTTRPKMQFVSLSGPEQGKIWPVTGMALVFGGPNPPPQEHDLDVTIKIEKLYDQELESKDERIPSRALLLVWKELESAFELSRQEVAESLSVTLERHVDGADWIAELPAQGYVRMRVNDVLWLGDTALHLVSPEED